MSRNRHRKSFVRRRKLQQEARAAKPPVANASEVSGKPLRGPARQFREAVIKLPIRPPEQRMDKGVKAWWLIQLKTIRNKEAVGVLSLPVRDSSGKVVEIRYDPLGLLCLVYLEKTSNHLTLEQLQGEVIPAEVRKWAKLHDDHRSCIEELNDRYGGTRGLKPYDLVTRYVEKYL